jgi:hypothetical protein
MASAGTALRELVASAMGTSAMGTSAMGASAMGTSVPVAYAVLVASATGVILSY